MNFDDIVVIIMYLFLLNILIRVKLICWFKMVILLDIYYLNYVVVFWVDIG